MESDVKCSVMEIEGSDNDSFRCKAFPSPKLLSRLKLTNAFAPRTGVRQRFLQEINERSLWNGIPMAAALLLKPQGARCDYRTNPKQSLILEESEVFR